MRARLAELAIIRRLLAPRFFRRLDDAGGAADAVLAGERR